ncbi:MAG: ribosome maturation factor RimP [Eubacterium sp.]|nr:ribosome maturation factor RimP [Eubacterium sp.]
MAKSRSTDYEEKTEALLRPITDRLGMEIVDVEYVKEAGTWYLRAYIDKEGGVTVDDCEDVSKLLEPLLDREDFIEDSYVLEVSSPGLGRPLKKEKDFKRALGQRVEIHTFKPIRHEREWIGELESFTETDVTIIPDDEEEEMTINRKDISLIRMAFDW